MKFGLIGRSIQHSQSPHLYKDIIGNHVQYDLIDCLQETEIPTLEKLKFVYNGINITSPYKTHFFQDVTILNPEVVKLGAINTISFVDGKCFATNTDLIATEKILQNYLIQFPRQKVILLGSGVMAKLTEICLHKLNIPFEVKSRKNGDDMTQLDLAKSYQDGIQTLVINSCSRDFVFQGRLHKSFIFWDYNYSFLPHQNTLPSQVFSYQDGREMLRFQAEAAAQFWFSTNPKLKC